MRRFPLQVKGEIFIPPVTEEAYAGQTAQELANNHYGSAYVVEFHVNAEWLLAYAPTTNENGHTFYPLPAHELEALNAQLNGEINVTAQFYKEGAPAPPAPSAGEKTAIRFAAWLVDMIIASFLILPLQVIAVLLYGLDMHDPYHPLKWIMPLFMILRMANDSVAGRSFSKRMFGLAVVDSKTGRPANMYQCFMRNLTLCIYPVEAILLLNGKRRLGDRIASTRVVAAATCSPLSLFRDLKTIRLDKWFWLMLLAMVIVYGALLLPMMTNWD